MTGRDLLLAFASADESFVTESSVEIREASNGTKKRRAACLLAAVLTAFAVVAVLGFAINRRLGARQSNDRNAIEITTAATAEKKTAAYKNAPESKTAAATAKSLAQTEEESVSADERR